jgi:hypothetical protein
MMTTWPSSTQEPFLRLRLPYCSPPAKLPRCQGRTFGCLDASHPYSPSSSTPAAAAAQICSIRMYRRTLNFMVMENIFSTADGLVKPSAVYDIKGSWIDRNAGGTRSRKPEAGTYKDMDLNDKLYLPSSFRNRLRATLDADSLFLVGHRIMDYSLLLGVCNRPFVNGTKGGVQRRAPLSPPVVGGGGGGAEVPGQQQPGGGARGDGGAVAGEEGRALPFHKLDEGGMAAAVIQGPAVYHMGLVDILQVYDISKQLERFYKVYVLRKDGEGVSVMNPIDYQRRFMDNLELITATDKDLTMLERESERLERPMSYTEHPALPLRDC